MTIRETMADLALSVVGYGSTRQILGDAHPGDSYRELVAAGESTRAAADMMKMSGCGLVVRALWRRAGFIDPRGRLDAPYKVGSVLETLATMANEAGAWRAGELVARGEYEPAPGDVFWLESPEHVATLTRVVTSDAADIDYKWFSVDGGERDGYGAEIILNRVRVCRVDAANPSRLLLDGRELRGLVDIEALAAQFLPGGAS